MRYLILFIMFPLIVFSQKTLEIVNNQSWQTNKSFENNLVIMPGITLTIFRKAIISFSENAKVIVEPGGHLILDGGTLTSTCNSLWQGIEVQGTSTASQNPTDQGRVQVINGGTIENAQIAIRTVKVETSGGEGDFYNLSYTGGIVQCSDANFVNNKMAVQFFTYGFPSESNFSGCNFITDDNYFGNTDPDYFIRMSDIHGINYSSCIFENNSSNTYFGNGIYSFNAGFKVEGKCMSGSSPCTSWDYGKFTNLEYGIYATSGGAVYFPDIGHADFTANHRGVYFSGMGNGSITSCSFTTGPNSGGASYGLYLDSSTGYTVENNNFYQGSGNGIGLVVNKSGLDPNMIYRNYFEGMYFAVLAQNNNRAVNGSGLVLKCNQYVNNGRDQLVLWDSPVMDKTAGIAENQGANLAQPDAPAGNIFSWTGPTGTATDIYNETNSVHIFII